MSTTSASQPGRALVLCPMAIERAAVARAVERHARVVQTGVGKDAILAALRAEVARERPHLAILAGVCGALSPVPDCPPIARVVDEHGRVWTGGVGFDPAGVTLIAVDRVVATPADKRALAARTGAAIVDMESHAFADACEALGVRWTIVRGVSDTPNETLPAEVLGWLTPAGDNRPLRAVLDMLRRPTLVPHIVGVIRRSNRVLPLVAARVAALGAEKRGSTQEHRTSH